MSPEQKMKLSPLKWLRLALNVQIPSFFFCLRKIVKKNNLMLHYWCQFFGKLYSNLSPMSIEPFNRFKYDAYV